jgi:hypothetical protein
MLQNIETKIINENNYSDSEYKELLNNYRDELCSAIVSNDGYILQDTSANRHYIKTIHDKYHKLQKEFFPNNSGVEFNHLFINGKDIL